MSGIVGVFTTTASASSDTIARAMLGRMPGRGEERTDVWRDSAALVGVTRYAWEMEAGFSGPVLGAEEAGLVVVADASLYYRDDLRRALEREGVRASADTPSHLILAAYRAWGPACVERLEGDWAFILWDSNEKRVFCARDFGGRRPLFYAGPGETLVVASTISAVLAHPRCSDELNLVSVAADAAGFFAAPQETAYRDIAVLPAGWSLEHHQGKTRVWRHWSPPAVRDAGGPPFEEAAEHLRELLTRSVAERLSPSGPTSVWLSGGWDSTAVFGAGQKVLRDRGDDSHLRPVSISYPPGDPGREDELITAVAEHWGAPVRWLDIQNLPLLDHPEARAAARDEPFAHAFEAGNRALGQGSRSTGAHVAFDGFGGDQLFQVSLVYLADLFRTGRWIRLAQEWRQRGQKGGFRSFFHWAVQPVLPPPLLGAARVLRGGRALRSYLERPVPEWIAPDFIRRHSLLERERFHTPVRTGGSHAAHETYWYLTHPYFPRVSARVCSFALEEGVELRAPLYDRRIIEFALSRPVPERSAGRETKRLLRRAVRGLLPEHVLAPRPYRTGTTGSYLDRSLRTLHAPLLEEVFAAPLALAELGVVDAAVLRQRWGDFVRRGGGNVGMNLLFTLHAELWLRAYRNPARIPNRSWFEKKALAPALAE
jgi:asparagine synthase (glutamine-hydrolysing)